MPKKNIPTRYKKQASTTKKLIAQSRQQANRDLVAQWRLLRKIGAYNTKETAAEIRLTNSRIRAIKKKMREIQSQKMFKHGRVISPVEFGARKTKSGKTVYDYHLNKNFDFVKSKFKPSAIEGIHKVGDGYIIEKTSADSKIKINKRGDIVEVIGKQQRIRKRYSGRDLLKLMDRFDNGSYKFRKHDFIVLHKWGSPNEVISATEDGVRLLSKYVETLKKTMNIHTFNNFINASYVEIIKMIDR